MTLDVISSLVDTPNKLSLEIFVGGYGIRQNRPSSFIASAENSWMSSLSVAQALRDLFIYMEWPRSKPGTPEARYAADLERAVMGPRYDSEARGKWADLPRLWYFGTSREGPVFAADGSQIWPRRWYRAAFEPQTEVSFTYV
ncbi:hypothetical protein PG984_014790 [Apiospora sp. TS-2023a]